MNASLKPARKSRAKKKGPTGAPTVPGNDLAYLAKALTSSDRVEIDPPQPQDPQRDPVMWSKLFGMWS